VVLNFDQHRSVFSCLVSLTPVFYKVATLEENIARLAAERDKFAAESLSRLQNVEQLESSEREADQRRGAESNRAKALELHVEQLREEVEVREAMLHEREDELKGMKRAVDDARRTKLWAQSAMEEVMDTSADSLKSITRLETIIGRLGRELTQLMYERDTAEAEIQALQTECDKAVSKGEWFGAVARALVQKPKHLPDPSPTADTEPFLKGEFVTGVLHPLVLICSSRSTPSH